MVFICHNERQGLALFRCGVEPCYRLLFVKVVEQAIVRFCKNGSSGYPRATAALVGADVSIVIYGGARLCE